jgi:serine O-acetyltransferase
LEEAEVSVPQTAIDNAGRSGPERTLRLPRRFKLEPEHLDEAFVEDDPLETARQFVRILTSQLIGVLTPARADTLEEDVHPRIAEDLLSYSRDAAAVRRGGWPYVFASVDAWRAVALYRVAHALTGVFGERTNMAGVAAISARQISEAARHQFDVEINPHAQIGARFMIDHGSGTVIGEDVRIGEDCVLLDRVRLGARRVADGPVEGRRHPTLGDRVLVASDVSVLGPVTVGSDTLIRPGCKVTGNVPPHMVVRVGATGGLMMRDSRTDHP